MSAFSFRPFVLIASLSIGSSLQGQVLSVSQSQLFFDASGSDQGAFGPNEIITISGNITYFGKFDSVDIPGAHPDVFFPVADIYVLPAGYLHTTVSRVKLKDVSGAANTVIGVGGGGFMEQVIATTKPVGKLHSGAYDVVIDEDQDGYFNPSHDFQDTSAFTVLIPANVPSVPGTAITAMKTKAKAQYQQAVTALKAFEFIVKIASFADGGFPEGRVDAFFIYLGEAADKLGAHYGIDPKEGTKVAMLDNAKRYQGIAADPPDLDYANVVLLSPSAPVIAPDTNAFNQGSSTLANALRQENALAGALLSALEKFQGAQLEGHGYWALAHAREIQMYGRLLSQHLGRTAAALTAFQSTVAKDPRDFDGAAASLRDVQARVRDFGLSLDEQKELQGLGLDAAAIASFRNQILTAPFDLTRAQALAQIDGLAAAATNAVPAYAGLGASMDTVISNLLAQDSLDASQPIAQAMGPYNATVGVPIRLDGSLSTDPQAFTLTYGWDLDGDGQFNDAFDTNASHAFPSSFSGYIGLAVTNTAGKSSVAYAFVDVTDTNQAPVFTSLSPNSGNASVPVGTTLSFQANAIDPNGDPVSLQWFLDGQFAAGGAAWDYQTSAGSVGLHDVTVRASDGTRGVTSHFWLTTVLKPISLVDLEVSQTHGPNPAQVGKDIVFTITVTNSGPNDATGVVLSNSMPALTTFVSATLSQGSASQLNAGAVLANLGTLTNGQSALISLVVSPTTAGTFFNTVSVAANEGDINQANNISDEKTRITNPATLIADLAVNVAANATSTSLSNILTYVIRVRNTGPADASGVVLTEALAPGLILTLAYPAPVSQNGNTLTFKLGTIPSSILTTVPVTLLVQPTNTGVFTSVASVQANEGDPDFGNNQATAITTVNPPSPNFANPSLTLTASTNVIFAGDLVTYLLSLINLGPGPATGVTVNNTLPPDVVLLSAVPSQGSASALGGVVTADMGTLTNGGTAQLTLTVKTLFAGPIVDLATVGAVEPNSSLGSSSVSLTLAVANSTNGAATVGIVQNFQDPEIIQLQMDLAEMGMISQVFDQEGLTFDALKNFKLIIWDDLSWGAGGLGPNDVDVYQAAADAHIPLYFIGDDLALSATYALEGTPQKPLWVNLIHLNATSENSGGNRTFSIIDQNHPVVNGPFGLVGDSNYGYDPDNTTRTDTGEVLLGRSGSADVLVAFKDPVSGRKSVTQNVLPVTQTDPAGIGEKKKLFKNAVTWLLATDPVADLSVTSSAQPATVAVGQYLTYRFSVANAGPDQAESVVLTTTLPAGLSLISADPAPAQQQGNTLSFNLGNVANANIASNMVTLLVEPLVVGNFTNTATVSTIGTDPSSSNNQVSQVVTALAAPTSLADVSLSQIVSTEAPMVNSNLVFTFSVFNSGPDAANNVTLVDVLPAGVVFVSANPSQGSVILSDASLVVSLGSMPPGSNALVAIMVQPLLPGLILNRGTVTSMDTDINPADNSALIQAVASAPSGANEVLSYQSTAWRYSTFLTNDVLSVGFAQPDFNDSAWSRGVAAFGNRGACPLQVNVRTTWPQDTRLVARHELSLPCAVTGLHVYVSVSDEVESVFFNGVPLQTLSTHTGCPGKDDFRFDVPLALIRPGRNLVAYQALSRSGGSFFDSRIVADPAPANPNAPDLAISASVSSNALITGSSFALILSVTNSGLETANGVTLTDSLPEGLAMISALASQGTVASLGEKVSAFLGALTNGASVTVTLFVTPASPGMLLNVAGVATGDCETNLLNNQIVQTLNIESPVADLALSGGPTAPQIALEGLATYSFVVHNNGPQSAEAVTFNDLLPFSVDFVSATSSRGFITHEGRNVRGNLGTLTNGESAALNIVVQATALGTFTNRSTVSSLMLDLDASNNVLDQSTVVPTAAGLANLTVTLRASESVNAGQQLRYVINVANAGPLPATGIRVTNTLPPGFVLVSSSVAPVPPGLDGVLVFALGALAPGASTNLEVFVLATLPGLAVSSASVSGNEPDGSTENNSVALSTSILPLAQALPDLSLSMMNNTNLVTFGNPWIYGITVTNRGATDATGVVVSNTLPPHAGFVSATSSSGNALQIGGAIVANLGTLAAGSSALITITLMPTNVIAFVTKANVLSIEPDANPGDNTGYTAVTVSVPGAAEFAIDNILVLPDESIFIEFGAIPLRTYAVQYSTDLQTWHTSAPTLPAVGNHIQWIDSGPPKTDTKPAQVEARFYRAILLPGN